MEREQGVVCVLWGYCMNTCIYCMNCIVLLCSCYSTYSYILCCFCLLFLSSQVYMFFCTSVQLSEQMCNWYNHSYWLGSFAVKRDRRSTCTILRFGNVLVIDTPIHKCETDVMRICNYSYTYISFETQHNYSNPKPRYTYWLQLAMI